MDTNNIVLDIQPSASLDDLNISNKNIDKKPKVFYLDHNSNHSINSSDLSDSSVSNGDSKFDSDLDNNHLKRNPKNMRYKKLSFKQVEQYVDNYFDNNYKISSAFDILASYLKGQKIIYMESKCYCERQLNLLMMPSLLLSASATVLTSVIMGYFWGSIFISTC